MFSSQIRNTHVIYQSFFYKSCRAADHIYILNLTRKRLKNFEQSAVSDHSAVGFLKCNCSSVDFDHFDVVASDRKKEGTQNF